MSEQVNEHSDNGYRKRSQLKEINKNKRHFLFWKNEASMKNSNFPHSIESKTHASYTHYKTSSQAERTGKINYGRNQNLK